MKKVGINKVILIRSGYRNWVTYPSKVLKLEENVIDPNLDLVELFLRLSEKYNFDFFFGLVGALRAIGISPAKVIAYNMN